MIGPHLVRATPRHPAVSSVIVNIALAMDHGRETSSETDIAKLRAGSSRKPELKAQNRSINSARHRSEDRRRERLLPGVQACRRSPPPVPKYVQITVSPPVTARAMLPLRRTGSPSISRNDKRLVVAAFPQDFSHRPVRTHHDKPYRTESGKVRSHAAFSQCVQLYH